MFQITMLLLAALCTWCVEECECYPNGSVAISCGNLMPVHPPFTPSTSSPPFTLSASSATYRPGGLISGDLCSSIPEPSHLSLSASLYNPIALHIHCLPSPHCLFPLNNLPSRQGVALCKSSAVKVMLQELTLTFSYLQHQIFLL